MGNLKFKAYDIIDRAVSEGVAYGLHRAYKYSDNPSNEQLQDQIERAVMHELSEIIDFEADAQLIKEEE